MKGPSLSWFSVEMDYTDWLMLICIKKTPQSAFTLTIETLEQGVKYGQC